MTEVPAHDDEEGRELPSHTVFLSYSRADQKRARSIVRVLEGAGFRVWWDTLLEGGERFSRTTEAALESASAVVVLWSKTSANSHWVQDEAARGRDSGRLVPVSLDGSLPPLGFGQFQAIDVSRAAGKPGSEPMQKLVRAVAALHGQASTGRPAIPAQSATWITRRSALLGTGALVLAGAGGWLVWKESGLFGGEAGRSVAVLPFANLSGDAEQKYFSDGLTAEIRTRLSRNALLQVVGQASSESASEGAGDARSIAQRLGVAFLLSGNVQKAGERIKVAAELIDGASGISRWAQSYERPLTDIFAVQAEIGAAVATALSAEIGGEDERSEEVGGTDNVEAFDAYLRGRDLYEAGIDEQSDRQALAWFDRAIALDERYAGAHAARSRALAIIGNLYAGDAERIRLYDEAVVAARRATELAAKFAEGFSALGFALATGQLDMRGARAPFQKSYELGPGSADILSRYATFRSNLRDHDRAKRVIEQAEKLDPLNARTFRSSGDISFGAGEYEQAITAYRKAISLNTTLSGVYSSLGFAQLMQGQVDEAYASFSEEESSVRRLPGYAIIAHRRGNQVEAQAALDALIEDYGDKSNYQYAQVYAQWGDRDRALAALQKALDLRDGGIMLMYNDPLLEPLRNTAGYRALAKRVGFS